MKLESNRFKQRLLAGARQYGLWLGLPDASCAEICAQTDFDWLLIDAEHAPLDIPKILELLRATAPYPGDTVLRTASDDPTLIKQCLDIGAQSLLVPMIESQAQAERLAHSARYAPQGGRGVGTSLARAARWNSIPNYARQANEEICVIAQIETKRALNELEGICKTEGIDAVFIGPSDLAASLGHLGDAGHPEVHAAIEEAIRTSVALGKAAGLLSLDLEFGKRCLEWGASFLGCGVDTQILRTGAEALAARARK